jgi:[acyl-carrier-protein] S-malonyltransferase
VKLCFASSDAELGKMSNAYTSLFVVSSSIVALLKEQGIKPSLVAGYNQGEYAAIFAGNGFTLPDGLYLLNKYASFYEAALKEMNVSAVRVSGIKKRVLENICTKESTAQEKASIAIYQSDTVHIVTGDANAVQRVRDSASKYSEKQEIDIELVSLEMELHSPYMAPVLEQFRIYLEKVDFKDLMIPLARLADGSKIEQGDQVREQIIKRITSPVMWNSMKDVLESYDIIVEVGPGTMLSQIAKQWYPDKTILAINKQADIDELKKVAGIAAQPEAPAETSDNTEKKSESGDDANTDSSKQE